MAICYGIPYQCTIRFSPLVSLCLLGPLFGSGLSPMGLYTKCLAFNTTGKCWILRKTGPSERKLGHCGCMYPSRNFRALSLPLFASWSVRRAVCSTTCSYHDVLLCYSPTGNRPSGYRLKSLKVQSKINLSSSQAD